MAEEENIENPQSLEVLVEQLEQRVVEVWNETITGLQKFKDHTLSPAELMEFLEKTGAFEISSDIDDKIDTYFKENKESEDVKQAKEFVIPVWQVELKHLELPILGQLSYSLYTYLDLIDREGNTALSEEDLKWMIKSNWTTRESHENKVNEDAQEYFKIIETGGLYKWLLYKMEFTLGNLIESEEGLIERGVLKDHREDLVDLFAEKLKLIMPLVKSKLRNLKLSDGEI
jgi:hypothetical protein